MEQLQQHLSTSRESEIPLSRIESHSQDDHASMYFILIIKPKYKSI